MNETDRLDFVLKKLQKQMAWKQAAADQAQAEIRALADKIKTLDDARLLVTSILQAEEMEAIKAAAPKRGLAEEGLQATVLRCLNEVHLPGASASDVVKMVKATGYLPAGEAGRNLYSSVYVALLRLLDKGEIERHNGPKGKLFTRNGPSRPLFPRSNGHESEAHEGEGLSVGSA